MLLLTSWTKQHWLGKVRQPKEKNNILLQFKQLFDKFPRKDTVSMRKGPNPDFVDAKFITYWLITVFFWSNS